MIRVLQVFGRMDRGGAEAMIMELYRHIDRTKIQFDFVVHTTDKCSYDDEIISLGGRIYSVPTFTAKTVVKYKKAWNQLLLRHKEWRIVHGHVRSTASIYLRIANGLGRYTIAHSHSVSSGSGIKSVVKNLLQKRIKADYYFACSNKAGEWLFGKEIVNSDCYTILPNAIEVSKFAYNPIVRKQVRNEMNICDSFIVGHVGSFYDVKNHVFLVDVFQRIKERCSEAILLLVGDGYLFEDIKCLVEKKELTNYVIFTKTRTDVNRLLQAMDVFVFPSKFEGLGIAVIEAQTSGLPTVISNGVPEESILVNDLVAVKRLDETADQWANCILSMTSKQRKDHSKEIVEKGYDIKSTSRWLEEFYFEKSKSL